MVNQISKQAILEFLNDSLESRKKYESRMKSTEAELTNLAKIELLQNIIGNIEAGMFEEQQYPIGFNHKKEIKLAF